MYIKVQHWRRERGREGETDRERESFSVCVFITAGPMIKLCAGGEGDSEGHVLCSMRYDEPRLVWTSLPITH